MIAGPIRRLFAIPALLAAVSCVYALDGSKSLSQYRTDIWRVRDGLPQDSVRAIAQTSDGFLWVGTQAGLARFDGVQFRVLDSRNTAALPRDHVLAMRADFDGGLWAGMSGGGLTYIKGSSVRAFTLSDGLPQNQIRSIMVARDKSVWLGMERGGLYRYDGRRFHCVWVGDTPNESTIRSLLEASDGSVWAGTDGGLKQIKGGAVVRSITKKDGLPSDSVWALAQSRSGDLWIGTRLGGLSRMDNDHILSYGVAEGLPDPTVIAICEDKDGNVWLGTDGGGLVRLSHGEFTVLSTATGFPSDIVRSVFEEREGSLWAGTAGGGLVRISDHATAFYTRRDGLSSNLIWSVAGSRSGGIWVGTADGVARFQQMRADGAAPLVGLRGRLAGPVHEDIRGDLWVCTDDQFLHQFPRGDLASPQHRQLQLGSRCKTIAEDRDGALWIGNASGLYRIQNSSLVRPIPTHGIAPEHVNALAAAPDGALWIGTAEGITRMEAGRFESWSQRDGLSNKSVISIHVSQDGSVWLGTYGGGLSHFAGGRFTNFTMRQGMPDDFIYAVTEDDRGALWMSCRRGVIRVQKSDLTAVANGTRASIPPSRASQDQLLGSAEFNYGAQPAVHRTADGRLWFPSYSGVISVDPHAEFGSRPTPAIYLDEVTADAKPMPLDAAPQFDAGVRALEFRYTAPSLLRPEAVHFRYMLEGFDKQWIEAYGRRTAYYTNLAPGQYTFRAAASNMGGSWSEPGVEFTFAVLPVWYKTTAFVAILLAATVFGIWSGHRWRVRALRQGQAALESRVEERTHELRQEVLVRRRAEAEMAAARQVAERADSAKSEFLANMSHEIRTPMNGVIGMTSLLLESPLSTDQQEYVETIRSSGELLMGVINEILDFSKIEAGHLELESIPMALERVIHAAASLVAKEANQKGIELAVYAGRDVPPVVTGDPGRLEQVLVNLMSNAVKFTASGNVRVSIHSGRSDDGRLWLRFEVADSGIGISEDQLGRLFNAFVQADSSTTRRFGGTGLGLAICKRLVTAMGGEIGVVSQPGKGSTFWFTLPLTPVSGPAVAEAKHSAPSVATTGTRILVVEDNAINQKVTRRLLERMGYSVEVVGNGLEAVRAFESAAYELIRMDCQMPVMDGYEATLRIREKETGGRRTPIIALTASAFEDAHQRCVDAGMDGYLTKPVRAEEMAEKLGHLLRVHESGAPVDSLHVV
ncbi:MAG: two-component regulator propeller domain-containing protein [Bryobacteraceae bacterium]